jgi:hypothetical protein
MYVVVNDDERRHVVVSGTGLRLCRFLNYKASHQLMYSRHRIMARTRRRNVSARIERAEGNRIIRAPSGWRLSATRGLGDLMAGCGLKK